MFKLKRKGQSILEYSIMLAVVIAVLLIMQSFVKRGYQGSLKSSADKMGEQFSAGNTTIQEKSTMGADQTITTEVATTAAMSGIFTRAGVTSSDVVGQGAYSSSVRSGVPVTSETQSKTESAKLEKTRLSEYDGKTVTDYPDPTS
ncbi:MAG: hypothetical protein KKE64_05595 [Candidatus Omnitrophica bacterium]|nr:hypothetical protein [Candidatus Omnitrophota bacterium]